MTPMSLVLPSVRVGDLYAVGNAFESWTGIEGVLGVSGWTSGITGAVC